MREIHKRTYFQKIDNKIQVMIGLFIIIFVSFSRPYSTLSRQELNSLWNKYDKYYYGAIKKKNNLVCVWKHDENQQKYFFHHKSYS